MEYLVRQARREDLPRILEIYAYARGFMARTGNPNQWKNNHPPQRQLEEDIALGDLYVVVSEGEIHGVFYFFVGADPTYGYIEGSWRSDTPYGTIHRIASDGCGGILKTAVAFGKTRIGHIRIDTHAENLVMQKALAKQGFEKRGIIYLENGDPRIAYDLLTQGG